MGFLSIAFGYKKLQQSFLFRPHLRGEELYTPIGFYVQTILADRYIHRREM